MKRIIALVDCDSFFVSCEQAKKPELKGQPVCVLSNNDGCIVSRSKEAKKMGIKMGMPLFIAQKEFPKAIYLSGNHSIYNEFSQKVMHCLKNFSPDVEIYSIDEAFIDLTGTDKLYRKNYIEIIKMIKETILQETDIPVSIGLSSSKTLAKLASDKAKNHNGIYEIALENINKEMKNTPIEEIWGIGKNITKTLKQNGILKCSDLINTSDKVLQKLIGIRGIEMRHELLGEAVSLVNAKEKTPKSIQDTSAFGIFTSDKEFIKSELNKHIHVACRKLRKHNCYCKSIGVMLRTKDFNVFTNKKNIEISSNFELEISKVAMELLEEIYSPEILYRATGIHLFNLNESKDNQPTLFNTAKKNNNENLAKAVDNLEKKYGKNIIRTGF